MTNIFSRSRAIGLCLVLLVALPQHVIAQDIFNLKAALTYNFAKFTHWPETHLDSKVWQLCYLGEQYRDSFTAISSKKIANKALNVVELTDTVGVSQCDIVYIDASYRSLTQRLFLAISDQPILTVSDISGFVSQGGMIEVLSKDNRLQFIVNQQALDEAGLSISSQVLSLALTVKR